MDNDNFKFSDLKVIFTYEDQEIKHEILVEFPSTDMSIVHDFLETMNLSRLEITNNTIIIPIKGHNLLNYQKFNNYINLVSMNKFKEEFNFDMNDLDLADYLGYKNYVGDIIFYLINQNNINMNIIIYDKIIKYNLIPQYIKKIYKYLRLKSLKDKQYIDFLEKIFLPYSTEIRYNKNKVYDDYLQKYIDMIDRDNLLYITKNYVFDDHLNDSFIYLKLLERAIKISKTNVLDFIINIKKMDICENICSLMKLSDDTKKLIDIVCYDKINSHKCKKTSHYSEYPSYIINDNTSSPTHYRGPAGCTGMRGPAGCNYPAGCKGYNTTLFNMDKCKYCKKIFD